MQATNGEIPGPKARRETANAAAERRRGALVKPAGVVLVIAGYFATMAVAITVPYNAQVLPDASFGFVILALVTWTLLVVLLVRVIRRLTAIAHSALPAEQRRVRPWAVDAGLAVMVFLGILWMIAVIDNGGFDQRCIDGESMTVVNASNCEGTGTQGGSGDVFVWYYGGRGTQVGDYVQGGSLDEPGTDDGGGSGSSGGSGGDDGGDGGSDGGGDGGD
jgi:uncharacterized membrane protein YgcG